MSEDSRTTTHRNLEEYRRFLSTEANILNTQLFELIQRTGHSRLTQSRLNTVRAVTTRLRDRTESLRLLLGGDSIPSRQTSSDVAQHEDLT
jgi:phage/plasmid-associated DNA primase